MNEIKGSDKTDIRYKKTRNTKKAVSFSIALAIMGITSLTFSLTGAQKLVFAPLSVLLLLLSAEIFYKFYLTDLVYVLEDRSERLVFSIYRTQSKSSAKIFEVQLCKNSSIEKYTKKTKVRRGALNFSSELFSKERYLLTIADQEGEKELQVIITVGKALALKIERELENLKKNEN